MNSSEIMDLLEWTGAIMKGHFKLTSGRHSDTYIEKFRLLENPIALDKICLTMSEKFKDQKIDLNELIKVNPGINPDKIQIGQKLKLP